MKNLKGTLLITILLLAFVMTQIPNSAFGASIEVKVDEQNIDVKIDSRIFQNITAFQENKVEVSGKELDEARIAFQNALTGKKLNQNISSIAISIDSNKMWLNETVKFTLISPLESERDTSKLDLSWLSFKVPADLKVGNLSYNLVGLRYFRPVIEGLTNNTSVEFFSPFFTPLTPQEATNIAGNVTAFDLESITENVSSWQKSYDTNTQTTVWDKADTKSFDFKIQINTTDVSQDLYSYTNTSSRVIVHGHAMAFGNTIIVETSLGRQELLMLSIVAIFIAMAVITHYYGRKIITQLRK